MKDVPDPTAGMQTVLTCNYMEALRGATLDGFGIAYMPDFLVRDLIESGSLFTMLDEYLSNPGQFWVLWPSSRHLSPKVGVFVDFMVQRLVTTLPDMRPG